MTVFDHPRLGRIYVVPHPTSRKFTARWKDGHLKMVVPMGMAKRKVIEALSEMESRLIAAKESVNTGHDIILPDWSLKIARQEAKPDSILIKNSFPECELQVGCALDITLESVRTLINKACLTVGKKNAPALLLPRAEQLAESLGCKPTGWHISHGHQILGHCDSKGRIALSFMNVFLPPELRDYIICHELAHLTYMNHSPQFHSLCNVYLGGCEAELKKKLKQYRWPVKR